MFLINVFSLLLIPMTIISYIPQYHRLLSLGSSAGISITSTLITTLVSQVQIFNMWFLFKLAPLMRYNIPIATPRISRDWLNLAQICVQWICSLILFVMIIFLPTSTTKETQTSEIILKATAVFIFLGYISLCIIFRPAGRIDDHLGFGLLANLHSVIINYTISFFLIISFLFQIRLTCISIDKEMNALSEQTLGFQLLVFGFLAVSWFFRLILPPNMWQLGNKPAVLMEWYPWVGWAVVNSAFMAIGQGAVLLVFVKRGGEVVGGGEEGLFLHS